MLHIVLVAGYKCLKLMTKIRDTGHMGLSTAIPCPLTPVPCQNHP